MRLAAKTRQPTEAVCSSVGCLGIDGISSKTRSSQLESRADALDAGHGFLFDEGRRTIAQDDLDLAMVLEPSLDEFL